MDFRVPAASIHAGRQQSDRATCVQYLAVAPSGTPFQYSIDRLGKSLNGYACCVELRQADFLLCLVYLDAMHAKNDEAQRIIPARR